MKLTTSITLALSLISTAAAQDFAFGCDFDSWELKNGHIAGAKCKTLSFKMHWSTLDLDKCFVNDDGVVKRGDNGKYSKSCRRCQMNPNRPTWMWCECKNKSKKWQPSETNLNDYIANQDGHLCCGNSCGENFLVARSDDDGTVVVDLDDETEEAI